MIIKELPHFTLLKEADLPEHYSWNNIRNRATAYANSHPVLHTNNSHPEGAGLIIEVNYVDYYWKSITKDLNELLELLK
jgi:hypothetical protein